MILSNSFRTQGKFKGHGGGSTTCSLQSPVKTRSSSSTESSSDGRGGSRSGSGRKRKGKGKGFTPASSSAANSAKKSKKLSMAMLQERHNSVRNSTGQLRTYESWATMFAIITSLMLQGTPKSAAITAVATQTGVKREDLKDRFQHFLDENEILVTRGDGRARLGNGNGRTVIKKHMKMELPGLIKGHILDKDYPLTCYSVVDLIERQFFGGETGVIGERQVANIMNELGYAWGALRKRYTETPERLARIDRFIVEYSEARKKDAEKGTHVLVFTDESYIHQNHARGIGQCAEISCVWYKITINLPYFRLVPRTKAGSWVYEAEEQGWPAVFHTRNVR